MNMPSRATLTLLAVFALGAMFASTAFAEATLTAEWLANAAKIAERLSTESTGELLLEDEGAASSMLCNGIRDGTVGPGAADTITEVLNLNDEKIELGLRALLGEGAGTSCVAVKGCAEGSAASPIEVYPVGLPWKSTLFLDATTEKFLDLVSATEIGYEAICLVLGVKVENKCTVSDFNIEVVNNTETGDAGSPSGSEEEPKANCSIGGAGKGRNVADAFAKVSLTSGELLTVSE